MMRCNYSVTVKAEGGWTDMGQWWWEVAKLPTTITRSVVYNK